MKYPIDLPDNYDVKYPQDAGVYLRLKDKQRVYKRETVKILTIVGVIAVVCISAMVMGLQYIG